MEPLPFHMSPSLLSFPVSPLPSNPHPPNGFGGLSAAHPSCPRMHRASCFDDRRHHPAFEQDRLRLFAQS